MTRPKLRPKSRPQVVHKYVDQKVGCLTTVRRRPGKITLNAGETVVVQLDYDQSLDVIDEKKRILAKVKNPTMSKIDLSIHRSLEWLK